MQITHLFKKFAGLAAVVLMACLLAAGQASAEMQTFKLQHRSAAELAETVRSLMGGKVKVAAQKNLLTVNADASELAQVARLVATYDRPQRMLRVTVEQRRTALEQDSDISSAARVQSGPVAAETGKAGQKGASTVRAGSTAGQVNVQARAVVRQDTRLASQQISVLEGAAASISVGTAVPFTAQLRSYCMKHPDFMKNATYQKVDTGFEVRPEIFGNMVRLQVRPFMSFVDKKKPRRIVFQELSTEVRIPLGAWYELGGQVSTRDGLSREILGRGGSATAVQSSIRLRVEPG